MIFSPWDEDSFIYSLNMIYRGNNPLSKLEVVSLININNQAASMYEFYYANRLGKINLKLYLGTISTFAYRWIFDNFGPENVQKIDPKSWPNSYQAGSQKGEAILCFP